ncbi:unnamed protein product, partial [Phaedon cochleariae]
FSSILLPVLLVLCYPNTITSAVQLTPFKYTNIEYGPGLSHLRTASSFGYGEGNIQPFSPEPVIAHQPLGYGYGTGLGLAHGPLGHYPNGLGYGGGVLGYPGGVGALGAYGKQGHLLGHGYYPDAVGINQGGLGYSRYGPVVGYGSAGHLGGSEIDQSSYSGAKNSLAANQHSSIRGQKGATLDHGDAGFRSGQVAEKDVRGESVRFTDVDGVNNGRHEGKMYHGGEHFDKEGKHAGENILNENHKKGHNVKSFKKSHHLDETGKTEEFYDEDHDEGGNYAFGGHVGKFGETASNSFKGGFNDGKFTSGEAKKIGHFGNEYSVDKVDGEHGKFGGGKYASDEHVYGFDRGVGEHGLGGHRQTSDFFKKYSHY